MRTKGKRPDAVSRCEPQNTQRGPQCRPQSMQSVDASRRTRNADRGVGREAAEDAYKREAS
eukprot:817044-Prorocentrum_minimum.AAC.1